MLKRLLELEKKLAQPGPAPVVCINAGEPIPEGARIVIIDDIPETPLKVNQYKGE